MKKFIKCIAYILCITISIFSLFGFVGENATVAMQTLSKEEKIICTANINDDFDDSCVLVILDKSISEINKRHDKSLFGNIEISNIEDLTYLKSFDAEKFKKINAARKKGEAVKNNELVYNIDADAFRQILKLELRVKSKANVLKVIRQLEKIEGIKYAGPNYYDKPCATNDTYFSQQWGLQSNFLNIEDAWQITTGSSSIKVGIMDTGISSHEDLSQNLTSGYDFYNDNAVTTDDSDGHGTHVAGIVGATCNNGKGISGVCQNVKLVPLQVANENNDLDVSSQVEAISYATNNQISIINYSGGSYTARPPRDQAIANYPGLFVCAAGNDAVNTDVEKHYPSSCNSNNIISVTSFNESGSYVTSEVINGVTVYYNYGATSVDLAAPGSKIYSTVPTSVRSSGYDSWSGTSMAAPYVTGVAALMMSVNPSLKNDPVAVKNIILSTVDKHSSLTGKCVSGGTLNAYKAVLGAANHYTYSSVATHGGRFFYTDDTDWFGTSCSQRVMKCNINNDGKTDLLAINYDGDICYTLNNGRGTYQNQAKITWGGFSPSWFWNTYNQRVWVADVNADGYDDFIGVSIDGHIYTSINNGNFTFTTPTSKGGTAFVSSSAWFSTAHSGRVWPADVNGDGRCDLIGISGDGNVYTCTANSNGTYGGQVRNLVVDGAKYEEGWFSNTEKSRMFIGLVDRYSRPDFIAISPTGYAHVSLQLCSAPH